MRNQRVSLLGEGLCGLRGILAQRCNAQISIRKRHIGQRALRCLGCHRYHILLQSFSPLSHIRGQLRVDGERQWLLPLRKLRTAMVRPGRERLHGPVEVDETYVGGIEEVVRGRGTNTKFIVGIAIEILSPKGFGGVRLQRLRDVSANSLLSFIGDAVEPGAEVYTDAWAAYSALARQGYRHKPINLSHSGDPAHVSMPGVHVVASLLKRWLLGTHQGSVTAQHLDVYLDEFIFRFNRSHSRQRGMLFYRLLENAVVTGPTRFRPTRALDSNHNR